MFTSTMQDDFPLTITEILRHGAHVHSGSEHFSVHHHALTVKAPGESSSEAGRAPL